MPEDKWDKYVVEENATPSTDKWDKYAEPVEDVKKKVPTTSLQGAVVGSANAIPTTSPLESTSASGIESDAFLFDRDNSGRTNYFPVNELDVTKPRYISTSYDPSNPSGLLPEVTGAFSGNMPVEQGFVAKGMGVEQPQQPPINQFPLDLGVQKQQPSTLDTAPSTTQQNILAQQHGAIAPREQFLTMPLEEKLITLDQNKDLAPTLLKSMTNQEKGQYVVRKQRQANELMPTAQSNFFNPILKLAVEPIEFQAAAQMILNNALSDNPEALKQPKALYDFTQKTKGLIDDILKPNEELYRGTAMESMPEKMQALGGIAPYLVPIGAPAKIVGGIATKAVIEGLPKLMIDASVMGMSGFNQGFTAAKDKIEEINKYDTPEEYVAKGGNATDWKQFHGKDPIEQGLKSGIGTASSASMMAVPLFFQWARGAKVGGSPFKQAIEKTVSDVKGAETMLGKASAIYENSGRLITPLIRNGAEFAGIGAAMTGISSFTAQQLYNSATNVLEDVANGLTDSFSMGVILGAFHPALEQRRNDTSLPIKERVEAGIAADNIIKKAEQIDAAKTSETAPEPRQQSPKVVNLESQKSRLAESLNNTTNETVKEVTVKKLEETDKQIEDVKIRESEENATKELNEQTIVELEKKNAELETAKSEAPQEVIPEIEKQQAEITKDINDLKSQEYDSKNKERLPSEVEGREATIEGQPDESRGISEVSGDRILEEAPEQVASKYPDVHETTDPTKLAEIYLQEQRELNAIDPKERAIRESFGKNVSRNSFIRFSDKNNITAGMGKTFGLSEKGKGIDQIAQEASYGFSGESESITPQDVVDYMIKYQGGQEFHQPRNNPKLQSIQQKYKELTGKNLNANVAKSVTSAKNRILAKEQQSKALNIDEKVLSLVEDAKNNGVDLTSLESLENLAWLWDKPELDILKKYIEDGIEQSRTETDTRTGRGDENIATTDGGRKGVGQAEQPTTPEVTAEIKPVIEGKTAEIPPKEPTSTEKPTAEPSDFEKSLKRESVIEDIGSRYADMTPEEIRADIKENMGLSTDEKASYQKKVDEFKANEISFEKKSEGIVKNVLKYKKGTMDDLNHLLVNTVNLTTKEGKLREALAEADPKDKPNIQKEILDNLDKQNDLNIAASILGTQSSNIFRALQQVVKSDYSYAGMEKRYKQTRGIKGELTPEQKAEVRADYETDLQLKKNYDEAILREEKLKEENETLKRLIDEVRADEKATKKRNIKETAEQKIKKSNDRIANSKAIISERLKQQRGQLSAGLPIDLVVAKEIGNIAKEKISQGITTLDAITKSVLEDIKDILPDWNERDVRDHLSGYGKEVKQKTKDELSKQFTDIKKEAYWTSKYEDLLNGKIKDPKERKKIEESEVVKKIKNDYKTEVENKRKEERAKAEEFKKAEEERYKTSPSKEIDLTGGFKVPKETLQALESERKAKELGLDIEGLTQQEAKDLITYTKTQLSRINTSKEQVIKDIKSLEETGKKTQKVKKEYQESDELRQARLDLAIHREQLKMKEREALMKNRTKAEKAWDMIYQYKRAMILLYPETFLKIGGNVLAGTINKPFEMGALKGVHKILPKRFSDKSDVYSEPQLEDLGKFYKTFIEHFTPRGQREWNDLKKVYGDEHGGDLPKWLEIGGRSHAFVKGFLAHSEYNLAKDNIIKQYIREGKQDKLLEDATLKEIEQKAYQHSMYSILMNDNVAARAWRHFTGRILEPTIGKPATTFFAKMEIPIVRVPSNYIARELTYALGGIKGLTGTKIVGGKQEGLIELLTKADKTLTPEQANFVLKNLSKGGVGLGYMALATAIYKQLAMVSDKEDDELSKTVKKNLKKLLHVPQADLMFSVANTMNEAEKEAEKKGIKWDATKYAGEYMQQQWDLVKKVPFLNSVKYGLVGSMFNSMGKNGINYPAITTGLMNSLISFVTPGFIKSLAKYTEDETQGGAELSPEQQKKYKEGVEALTPEQKKEFEIKGYGVRQPKTPMEVIYQAFPFLINKVPTNVARMINEKHKDLTITPEEREQKKKEEKQQKVEGKMTKDIKKKVGFEYR